MPSREIAHVYPAPGLEIFRFSISIFAPCFYKFWTFGICFPLQYLFFSMLRLRL